MRKTPLVFLQNKKFGKKCKRNFWPQMARKGMGPMLLTFEKDKTIWTKPFKSNDRKMKDRNMRNGYHQKNAHRAAT